MNESLQKIVEAIVLNEEISLSTRLTVLEEISRLAEKLGEGDNLGQWLRRQTQTKSAVTNQLAQTALDWLTDQNHA